MRGLNVSDGISEKDQKEIDGQKKLMSPENADLFQRTCERVYSEPTSEQEKAKQITPVWLYCLGFTPEVQLSPIKTAKMLKELVLRAKKNGVKISALEKIKAMAKFKVR